MRVRHVGGRDNIEIYYFSNDIRTSIILVSAQHHLSIFIDCRKW